MGHSQSAMEYLMTYGWAIIVILVVLAVLYTLGIFTPGATLGNQCSGNFKFTCSSAVLSTNGSLSFDFGQNTGAIVYNLAFACTETKNSSGGPYAATSPWYYVSSKGQLLSSPTSGFSLESGRTIRLLGLPCFGQDGAVLESGIIRKGITSFSGMLNIGQRFTGILWVRYTTLPGTISATNAWVQQQAGFINAQAGASGGTISTTSTTSSTTVSGGTYSCSTFSTCETSQPGYVCPNSCSTQCNATSNSNPACGWGKYCTLNQIQCVSTTVSSTTTPTSTTLPYYEFGSNVGYLGATVSTSTDPGFTYYICVGGANNGTGAGTPVLNWTNSIGTLLASIGPLSAGDTCTAIPPNSDSAYAIGEMGIGNKYPTETVFSSAIGHSVDTNGILAMNYGTPSGNNFVALFIACGYSAGCYTGSGFNRSITLPAGCSIIQQQFNLGDNGGMVIATCLNQSLGTYTVVANVPSSPQPDISIAAYVFGGSTATSSTTTSTTSTSTTTVFPGYVPITLINNAGTTAAPFQQLINVQGDPYRNSIMSNWSNIEFTSGAALVNSGTPLQAWIENNVTCSPSSCSNASIWVNIPGGVPVGSATIYLNFLTSPVLSSGGPTGKAPQFGGSYGVYDNGVHVFNYYDNFAGTSLDSGWTSVGTIAPTINDGVTLSTAYASCQSSLIISSASFTPPETTMAGIKGTATALNGGSYPGIAEINSSTTYAGYSVVQYASPGAVIYRAVPDPGYGWSFGAPGSTVSAYINGTVNITWVAQSNQVATLPGATVTDTDPTFGAPSSVKIGLGIGACSSETGLLPIQWVAARAYPPSGIMPGIGFGSFVST